MAGCCCLVPWTHFGGQKVLSFTISPQSLGKRCSSSLSTLPLGCLCLRVPAYQLSLSFPTSSFGFGMSFGSSHIDRSHPPRSVLCPWAWSVTPFSFTSCVFDCAAVWSTHSAPRSSPVFPTRPWFVDLSEFWGCWLYWAKDSQEPLADNAWWMIGFPLLRSRHIWEAVERLLLIPARRSRHLLRGKAGPSEGCSLCGKLCFVKKFQGFRAFGCVGGSRWGCSYVWWYDWNHNKAKHRSSPPPQAVLLGLTGCLQQPP